MYSDLHWLLWDTLFLPDVHSRLFHWVGQKKNMAFCFVTWLTVNKSKQCLPSVLGYSTKGVICHTNKAAKYKQIRVLVAQRKFRGGWKNRKCVQIMTDDFWQSSAHTDWQFWEWNLQWNTGKASVGIGSWHWVIVWLPQPLKISYWPFQTWSISSNLNYVGRPTTGEIWEHLTHLGPLFSTFRCAVWSSKITYDMIWWLLLK